MSFDFQTNQSKNIDSFCYVCAQFDISKKRELNSTRREYFFDAYGKNVKSSSWCPKSIDKNCLENIRRYSAIKKENEKLAKEYLPTKPLPKLFYLQPAKWCKPSKDHKDCYVYLTQINKFNRNSAASFRYPECKSSIVSPVKNFLRTETIFKK